MAPQTLNVKTDIHGRVLLEDAAVSIPRGLVVVFHGYGQRAEDALTDLHRVPGIDGWQIAAPQALHRFYLRGGRSPEDPVVGSWMTREDRDLAITDAVNYVDRVIDRVLDARAVARARAPGASTSETHIVTVPRIVFVGFSQGASMAYRAAILGSHRAAGIVALGGDIPPEVKPAPALSWPRVLVGAGDEELWYTASKVAADEGWLAQRGITHTIARFAGGHEWTDEFRVSVGAFLDRC